MTNTDLLIRLRDLHEELSTMNDDLDSAESVNEETIDALGQLVTDVSDLVDHARDNFSAETLSEPNVTQTGDEVLDRIKQFETNHPRVTSFLSQVTDILAMMGI